MDELKFPYGTHISRELAEQRGCTCGTPICAHGPVWFVFIAGEKGGRGQASSRAPMDSQTRRDCAWCSPCFPSRRWSTRLLKDIASAGVSLGTAYNPGCLEGDCRSPLNWALRIRRAGRPPLGTGSMLSGKSGNCGWAGSRTRAIRSESFHCR